MKILALDLAGRTGWASGDSASEPLYGHLNLRGTSPGVLFGSFREWLEVKVEAEEIEVLVYEAPVLPPRGKTAVWTVQRLMGLAAIVQATAWSMSKFVATENNSTVKKFFTGSGQAEKAEMVRVAKLYGWDTKVDDEADALAVWCISVMKLDPKSGQRFRMGPLWAAPLGEIREQPE